MICYLCGRVANDEDFCHGCGQAICENCDNDVPTGLASDPHDPKAHEDNDGWPWSEDIDELNKEGAFTGADPDDKDDDDDTD